MSGEQKKYRILHVVRQFYPSTGGMERFVGELAQRQLLGGHMVCVLTLNRIFSSSSFLPTEELMFSDYDAGLRVVRLSFFGGPRFFLPGSLAGLDFAEFDIVHLHGLDNFLVVFVFLKIRGLLTPKLVLSTHGGFFHTRSFYRLKKLWFHTITRMQLRQVDMVCACSVHDLLLFRGIGCKRIELIENGVDVRSFVKPDKQPDLQRLLYVGGFRANKRVMSLLRWFARAVKEWPDLSLSLVGEGEEKESCINFAREHNLGERVRFLGFLTDDELHREYISAGLFVSASDYEGFGLSVVEAMAAGCLLLLNDIDSFRVFVPEEKNGFIVDFSKMAEISRCYNALRSLTTAAVKEKSDNSVRIAARFDWGLVQKSFAAVYDLLLNTKQI